MTGILSFYRVRGESGICGKLFARHGKSSGLRHIVTSTYAQFIIMIPLDEFKKLLGPSFASMPEDALMAIRNSEDRLAGILFDLWLDERKRTRESTEA